MVRPEDAFEFYSKLDEYTDKELKDTIDEFRLRIKKHLPEDSQKYLDAYEHSIIYYIHKLIISK